MTPTASPHRSSTVQVSAPILRLSASQRPVFLLNSRLGLFTAAYSESKHPFSRSYGVILPSSLTRVVPLTFEYSSCLPVSVSGTGTHHLARGFSWQCGIWNFGTLFLSPSQLRSRWTDLPIQLPHCLGAHIHRCAFHILLRHPIAQTVIRWYRNIDLLSIAYAFRPRLRSRLTLSARAFLSKPSASGERARHPLFAPHTGILTSKRSISPHGLTSQPFERSPTIVPSE